jgi:hypothetical protein
MFAKGRGEVVKLKTVALVELRLLSLRLGCTPDELLFAPK